VAAGDELYRIVDLSNVWVIADVAEGDLADIKLGAHATVTFKAYRSQPVDGVVTFIYPEVRTETRTVRVRIEVPNPDERLKPDMYADVVFHADADRSAVTSVPARGCRVPCHDRVGEAAILRQVARLTGRLRG
jgi:Cu(I)/Ag(I) efflux system membrane fusion protein